MTIGASLYSLSENDRIRIIGETAKTQLTGIIVETNDPSDPKKLKRYIKKITEQFPEVKHIDTKTLTAGTSLVRFGPKRVN